MKIWLKLMAVLPWWLVGRLVRLDKWERDYDFRTIKGALWNPLSRMGYVIGWVCWFVLLAGIVIFLKWRLKLG